MSRRFAQWHWGRRAHPVTAERNPIAYSFVELADKLAVKRLACGVLPELDDCFKALALA